MHLEKLVTILKKLDDQQLKRLKEYVESPYFHVPPVCGLLLDRLIPLHPKFSEKKMQPRSLGKKDHRLCTASKQSNAGSFLLRAIEGFLAQEQWLKKTAEINRLKIQGYQELGLLQEWKKAFHLQMDELDNGPEQNTDFFFEKHALTELSLSGFNAKLNRSSQNDILPIVKTLDEFYALKKLRYLCEALNRQQVLGSTYGNHHIETLLKILEPYTNIKFPYVYLFVNIYRMMSAESYDDGSAYYEVIKRFASEYGSSSNIREAMGYAINRCLYWHNKGYDNAGDEYLWWINWRADHNLLLEHEKIMPITFRNVVRIAVLNNRNPEWIDRWISIYAPRLPDDHYDTNLAFARGLHQYTLKNHVEAIRFFLIAQAKEEVLFNSSIRLWEWMCLYEYNTNDVNVLYNHLQNFEKYLQRNRKELLHLSGALNRFIEYGMKLLKSANEEKRNVVFLELQNEEHFAGKAWLLQQFSFKNKKPVRSTHG